MEGLSNEYKSLAETHAERDREIGAVRNSPRRREILAIAREAEATNDRLFDAYVELRLLGRIREVARQDIGETARYVNALYDEAVKRVDGLKRLDDENLAKLEAAGLTTTVSELRTRRAAVERSLPKEGEDGVADVEN